MRWLRKIAAILVMVLAAVGFLLCVGLLIGSWAVNEPATEAVTGTLGTVEGYLGLASDATTRASETLGDFSQELDQVEQSVANMSEEDKARVADEIRGSLQTKLGPYVDGISRSLNAVSTGMEAVNRTVSAMNRAPRVAVPEVGGELDVAIQRLDTISAGLDEMRAAVSEASFEGTKVQNSAATISDRLSSLESSLAAWQSRIDATRNATVTAEANAPRWIDLSSTALTLLAILFGAGQVALFVAGWNWFKDEPET